jgi:hypothetical protein
VRAYINLHRGHELIRDGEGVEFADMAATVADTTKTLKELEQQDPTKWAGWRVNIDVHSETIAEAECA